MLVVQEILISDDVIEEQFLCDLTACKGACCWEGDGGAPVEKEEVAIMKAIFPKIKPYLSPAGLQAIEEQGIVVTDKEYNDLATPLIDNGPCAYMVLDEKGMAKCGIEHAWKDGVIDFKKPISCHLYPIRINRNEMTGFEALNYHQWSICKAACEKGKQNQLPVYQFLKEALVRKYGEDFFDELDTAAKNKKY